METPAWILVFILSGTLFLFLLIGIILLVKLIGVTKEAKKIIVQGQNIAEKAADIFIQKRLQDNTVNEAHEAATWSIFIELEKYRIKL